MGNIYSEIESENGSVIEYIPETKTLRTYHENRGCFISVTTNIKNYILRKLHLKK